VSVAQAVIPAAFTPSPSSPTLGSLLAIRDRQIAAFDDRYGREAHARLLARLARPCVSFAEIAVEFGVSRERVRQWRQQWAPEAPSGLERRRQCLATRRRRQLLDHPSFRLFYLEVRRQVPAHRLGLVAAQSGFRKRIVRIDKRVAVLTTGRPVTRYAGSGPPTYALPPVPSHAAFVYVQLGEGDYLFVPATALPARGTTFVDTPSSKYQRFRRTFAAIDAS
jgi:transposase-like protein